MKSLPLGLLVFVAFFLSACGGGDGSGSVLDPDLSSPTDPIDVQVIDIDVINGVSKAKLNDTVTVTVDVFSSYDVPFKLNRVQLRASDQHQCRLISYGQAEAPLSYTFATKAIGECQFEYEVVPVSEAYQGKAIGKDRIAVSQMLGSDELAQIEQAAVPLVERAGTLRNCTTDPTSCSTVYALDDSLLPAYSAAYFIDDNTVRTINLKDHLGEDATRGFTLETDIAVLGQLDSTQVTVVDAANYIIQLNTPFTKEDAGYSRIEYALVNGTETKLGWIEVTISDTDGLNHAPTLEPFTSSSNLVSVYTYPDTLWVQQDANQQPIPNKNEIIFNILWRKQAPTTDLAVISTSSEGLPEVTLYVMDDKDEDTLTVINENDVTKDNPLGVNLYSGRVEVEDIIDAGEIIGSKLLVDINRGGKHTLSYTVSDDQGGYAIGLIHFRLPADIYSYRQEWADISLETDLSGIESSVADGVLKSTGGYYDDNDNPVMGAAEITFTAPLATQLAFFFDVDYKYVQIEDGDKGLEGYAITTYSYEQAQTYCAQRNARLPTLNEIQFLIAKQGNNLFSDYASPYTEPHYWPTTKKYWVAQKGSVEQAYVFDLNSGTGETLVDTGDAVSADLLSGYYTTCVMLDKQGYIQNYRLSDYQHSKDSSENFNAWMELTLLDPEGNFAAFEKVDVVADAGALSDVDNINYINPRSDYTQDTGEMYFYYNRCKNVSNESTCQQDLTLTSSLFVKKNNHILYIHPYSNADVWGSSAPLSIDINTVYANEEGGNVTIVTPDGTGLDDASLIRIPVLGGVRPVDYNDGIQLWDTHNTNVYAGAYLYRYPYTGKHFSIMMVMNECPGQTLCYPGRANATVSFGLQQHFTPSVSTDGIFREADIAGASDAFFPNGNVNMRAPAIVNTPKKNLMFNIRRDYGVMDFFWLKNQSLGGVVGREQRLRYSGIFAENQEEGGTGKKAQFQVFWLDYDADTQKLDLYINNEATKPATPNKTFDNVVWNDGNLIEMDPNKPYYIVIGYYSQPDYQNELENNTAQYPPFRNIINLTTFKFKSWN